MQNSLNKSYNLFLKNSKYNNSENTSTLIKNNLTSRKEKKINLNTNKRALKFSTIFNKGKKGFSDNKKLNKKIFLHDDEENYYSSIDSSRQTIILKNKKIFNEKDMSISNLDKNEKIPINKHNDIFKNIIKNKERKLSENVDFNKEQSKYSIDKNKTIYFKFRKKECKSSSIDALQKRYKIYKDKFLNKYIQKNKTRISTKELNNHKKNETSKFLTFVNSNNNFDNEKQYSININTYKDKGKFNNNRKTISNFHNKHIHLFQEQYSKKVLLEKKNDKNENLRFINKKQFKFNNRAINTSNSSINQEKSKSKANSHLLLDLPSINRENSKKSINFNKIGKNPNPTKSLFTKSENSLKQEIPIKKTTINIYNNKINNINNIILNNKNIKNKFGEKKNEINNNNNSNNEKKENESYKSIILYDNENINNRSHDNNYNQLNLSVKLEELGKDNINKQKEINEIKNNENKIRSAQLSSKDIKIIKNKSNKKKKISKIDLKPKIDLLNGLKINNSKDNKLIRRLSLNYNSNFLNNVHMIKHKGEFIDKVEKKLRKKILYLNSIENNSIIEEKLQKIKKEITKKLFEELSKKISNDIEEEENNYKNKEKVMFDIKIMKNLNDEYISKVKRKTRKLIKKVNNIIYTTKNKLIQIYERNIANYSKITLDESKYLFFKYLFDNYFNFINEIINLNEDDFKCFKNCYLDNIYNVSLNNESRGSSIKQNENYMYSILLQYLLMEKDKIQQYSSNERYVEKTINQIKSLINQAKAEINDLKKTGPVKLNFIVNEESDKNGEKKENNGENKSNINSNNNNVQRSDIKKFTFLNLKNEFSDTDRYDSKSGYDTKGIFNGGIQFKYNKKVNFSCDIGNNLGPKPKHLLLKKNTINQEIFHSNFSNIVNNNAIVNNSLENTKKNIQSKYNLTMINKENIEKKYNKLITQNIDYFFKRKKSFKKPKKEKIRVSKKDIDFLKGNYMFKNLIDYRTDEIKFNIKNSITSPVEMLFYHIKEHDFDEFVELFERKQIDINSRNSDNDSFLIYAVKCKGINFVLYLLKKGINVNMENKLGNTALHYAFSDQNFKLADILLQHGADEFKTNVFGQTPWQCLGKKDI